MNKISNLEKDVIKWAYDKNIFEASTPLKQIEKTQEELTETRDAMVRHKYVDHLDDIKDGIGDMLVTVIILARMYDTDLQECLELAYNVIKNRNGSMKNGFFCKET